MKTYILPLCILFGLTLGACAAETGDENEPQASETTSSTAQDLTKKYTYKDTQPIIDKTCGGCHAAFKDNLAEIKASRSTLEEVINGGGMPMGNTGWYKTPDGKKVLTWLKTGADLK